MTRPLLPLVACLLVASISAQTTLLADDFNDNSLDQQLWVTVPCNSSSWLAEVNQRIETRARMHLVTQSEFDPLAHGGVRVTCRVTMNSVGPAGDVICVGTRSTGDTGAAYCTSRTALYAFLNQEHGAVEIQARGQLRGQARTTLQWSSGDQLWLQLSDHGGSASLTVRNETSGTQVSISCVVSGTANANHVEFMNREWASVGTAYFDDVEVAAIGTSASYTTYRQSCPSSVGLPTLSATDPVIGQPWRLTVDNLRANTTGHLFFALDDQRLGVAQLPLELTSIGAPGCYINVNTLPRSGAIMHPLPSNPSGSVRVQMGIPNNTAILGSVFFNQYVSLDAPASRPLRLTTTNAGRGVIGL